MKNTIAIQNSFSKLVNGSAKFNRSGRKAYGSKLWEAQQKDLESIRATCPKLSDWDDCDAETLALHVANELKLGKREVEKIMIDLVPTGKGTPTIGHWIVTVKNGKTTKRWSNKPELVPTGEEWKKDETVEDEAKAEQALRELLAKK